MNQGDRYRINSPSIVNETIDGEAVMINLDTGSYYSADKVGAVIWAWIDEGRSVGEILSLLCERYDGAPADIEPAALAFIQKLSSESLIVRTDAPTQAPTPPATERMPFAAPTLERYDDMKDLLLADPIHDVDTKGWPHRPEPSARD